MIKDDAGRLREAIHSAIYGLDCLKKGSVIYTADSIRRSLTEALKEATTTR